jgi:hypothetical protein
MRPVSLALISMVNQPSSVCARRHFLALATRFETGRAGSIQID